MIEVVNSDRGELVSLVRDFLADRSPLQEIRSWAERGAFDPAVWEQLGKELGLPAIGLPEEYGGLGYGPVEVGLVLAELGRGLYNGPYFSSIALAAPLLLALGDESQRAHYLPGIAAGERTAALAYVEPGASWQGETSSCVLREEHGALRLTGTKTLVVDGATADHLLVTAAFGDGGETRLSLALVDREAAGITTRALETLDLTRALAEVEFSGTPAVLLGEPGAASGALRTTLQQAAIHLAAEQLGGAERCLDMAVEYAKLREQFGRPIGSFQAVKHRCVDMLLEVESSRSAVLLGLTAMAGGEDLTEVSSLVRAHCSEAFSRVAEANIAVHGGIGFTWEHDAHLFLKRAKSSEALLGGPSAHRELLASAIGLGRTGSSD